MALKYKKPLSVDDVRSFCAYVKKYADEGDSEGAHAAQDEIYIEVLKVIASGAENARELAKEALKCEKMEFSRWYA